MMLTMFDAKKCLVRNAGLLGEYRVGKITSFFSQENRELLVEVASHGQKLAKTP